MKRNKYNQSMGELEAEVMDVIWGRGDATVRQVLNQIRKKRKAAYTTVMTVMSRLFDKGILRRRSETTGAYIYLPVQKKKDFLATASKRAINDLIEDFGEVAVAQFIETVKSSDLKNLANWRKKLKKLKN